MGGFMYLYTPILAIEITRKCNLRCAHCMREEAENVSVSMDLVSKLFDELIIADMLVISGGEPFLCYDEIKALCELKKQKCVKIPSVTIVTNGTVYDERIYKLLEENFEDVKVDISLDLFHRDSIDDIYRDGYKSTNPRLQPRCYDDILDNITLHSDNTHFRGFIGDPRNIVDMGRAVDTVYSKVQFEPLCYFWTDLSWCINSGNLIGVGPRIYMDTLGYITEGNSSYDVREEMSIGNIRFKNLSELVLENAMNVEVPTYQEFEQFIVRRETDNYNRTGKLYTYKDNKVVEFKREAVLTYVEQ